MILAMMVMFTKKYKNLVYFLSATALTVAFFHFFTYFDADSFLKGAYHGFQGSKESLAVNLSELTVFSFYYFGAFPLIAAMIAAVISLKNKQRRVLAMLFLSYFAFFLILFFRGRFQYDQDRYYLLIFIVFLPFFGKAALDWFGQEGFRKVAIVVFACYCICAYFYAQKSYEYFTIRQVQLPAEINLEKEGEHDF